MPTSQFDSPGKASTFSGSEDSLNRDREDDISEAEAFNYDIYDNESNGEYSGQHKN